MPLVLALEEQWRQCPPVAELVAAFIGYEPPAPEWDGDLSVFDRIAAETADLVPQFMPGVVIH